MPVIFRAIVGVLALAVPALCPVSMASAAGTQAEEACDPANAALLNQLLKIDDALEKAAQAGDMAAWTKLVADDYTGFDPLYQALIQDRDDAVATLKPAWAAHYHPASGDQVIARAPSFAEARRYGDVAILTYLATEAVKTADGRIKGGDNAKTTKIFLEQGGAWLLVHSEVSVDGDVLSAIALPGKPPTAQSAADQALQAELIAAEIAMEGGARNNDTALWRTQIVDNYSEFNSYYPYALQTSALNMTIQAAIDRNTTPRPHQNSARHYRVKRYGDVALLMFAAANAGEALSSGPRTKFTFVFVSMRGKWILAGVHADWAIS